MSHFFRITPKRVKRSNGQVLKPDMSIAVTTKSHTTTSFYNVAAEIKSSICESMVSTARKQTVQ